MKTTINLKELIEKNACEEGIKWFTRNFSVKNNEEVKDVVNHPECKDSYKLWLKENGYSVEDQQEKEWEEFFQQVKGKTIKWNSNCGIVLDGIVKREGKYIFDKEGKIGPIHNGFKDFNGNHWELYQEEEKEEWFICWDKVTYSVGCNRIFESTPKMPAKGKESDLKKMYIYVIRATKSDFEGLL